ncbi:MAG: TonB-dependent receptor [Lentimicrobium sp.]|jgi:TonB-linked SusC/RagA family outer membrane protein|uniref:TonB-linked outer membrane protein, SusC/RagA family n=2 Tax=root TaxID=1 RepID=A0A0S7C017_9BACT|nr:MULTISPECIES: TonB-dependent receptor [Lentimicrobium]MEA5109570.1 TonB-dependent receptor [Lentimicrobium sp.]GAP43406.1 TonB-linked outer membrane protein, SusC/RagA family [Lentimicrobium saccharophilum]
MKTYLPLMLLLLGSMFVVIPGAEAQIKGKPVTGIVVDSKGEPLTGVTVLLKATSIGTITDVNGKFTLETGSKSGPVLIFSYVGYDSQEVQITSQEEIRVVLVESNVMLNEVVVVGYGSQRKRDLTGSVSSVNTKELKTLPVPSIGDALQGRSAGVQVLSAGAPGSNVTLRIRGTGTINNSDPLLVIDGVPANVSLNTISPDDIAGIEILKDASAAAIYGSRGANGVVLITTKKGAQERNTLEFKMFTGVQSVANRVEMLNASEFASLHNDMMTNNGQALNPDFADPAGLGAGTDWLDAIFRNAPIQNYTLAYSGGNANSHYYVSGAILDQQGIVANTGYKRYTVQFNSDSRVFDWLKFSNNLTLNHDVKTSGDYNIRNAMAALPAQPVYNADGTYSGPIGQSSWVGDITNPIGKAMLVENSTKGYNALGNISAEINILKELKFKSTGGLEASFWDNRTWSPAYNWQPTPQASSYLFQQYNKGITYLWDNYLTYDKYINGNHHLTLLAGSSAQAFRKDYMSGSAQGFSSTTTQQLNNGTTSKTLGGSANEWKLLSFIGRGNYDYKGRYLLTATLRRDGSSRFGSNNRWGWFPSASVAWRVSQEEFMNRYTWLDDFKVRAGYGITGNQNIGDYSFASVLQTIQYVFNGQVVNAVVPLAIPNPSVRWEQVEQSNLGFDASLINGRINLSLDAYIKNTNDMLVPMSVPISTGYSDIVVPSINAGKVRNKGVEISITSINTTGAIKWTTSANVAYNHNRVINLNDTIPLYTGSIGLNQNLSIQNSGYPVNAFYGFVTNGLFQTQQEVDNYAVQVPGEDPFNRTSAGDIRFKDLNNDGKIDDNDRTYIGNPNPKFIFAINNTIEWRGFDLSIFLQGVYGNDIFNANRIYQEGMAVAQNQTTATLERWTGEGTSNTMPRAVFNDPNKNTRVSDRFIEDGSYLKIKNLTLGYTFRQKWLEKAKLSSARVYFSAQNLLTITNYSGFDPEVPVNGIDLNVYPVTRTVSAGINLIF